MRSHRIIRASRIVHPSNLIGRSPAGNVADPWRRQASNTAAMTLAAYALSVGTAWALGPNSYDDDGAEEESAIKVPLLPLESEGFDEDKECIGDECSDVGSEDEGGKRSALSKGIHEVNFEPRFGDVDDEESDFKESADKIHVRRAARCAAGRMPAIGDPDSCCSVNYPYSCPEDTLCYASPRTCGGSGESWVIIKNRTRDTVYYSLLWGSGSWQRYSLGPNTQFTHSIGGVMSPSVRFDWSYSSGYQEQKYGLARGTTYSFQRLQNGRGLNLFRN